MTAIIVRLVSTLRERGSWCGELHVQRACYLLQELWAAPLGLKFVPCGGAPYCFELSDQLAELSNEGVLEAEPRNPWPPGLCVAGQSGPTDLDDAITTIARLIEGRTIRDLERMTNTVWRMTHDAGTHLSAAPQF